MITDQLKKKVSPEIREHSLDEWAKFTSLSKLADRLDEQDSIRITSRNSLGTGPKGKIDEKSRLRTPPPERKFKNKPFSSPQHTPKWIPRHRYKDLYRSKSKLTCFNCGKEGLTSRICMKNLQTRNIPVTAQSNLIQKSTAIKDDKSEVLTAKNSIPVSKPVDIYDGVDDLKIVEIKYGRTTLNGIVDTELKVPNNEISRDSDDKGLFPKITSTVLAVSKKDSLQNEKNDHVVEETDLEICNIQKNDETLNKCFEWAEKETNSYLIDHGILLHNYYICGENIKQVVLPIEKRKIVLKRANEIPLAGHLGEKKTIHRIKYSFYWLTIKQDVKGYCGSCKECQLKKVATYKDRIPVQPIVRPETPFEVWSVDCIEKYHLALLGCHHSN
ncbi:retrovirus-related Pol polyprotein from transposon opus [Nephila pilipes]|uniref:Retrovirus-related Pol polyprotein from transposon opus n=1 Tax=Nephila pilipes TaxID=299642 RepID=A0A8X6N601_NEPPI|nr:retrovirus-related Pol polyprotein from transposon opus [Nephila pilipes]